MADTKFTINCPACGEKMKKVYIGAAGVNIDICVDGCGGMLFDNRELEKFDEKHENADEILNAVKDKEFSPVDTSKFRICPICNTTMVKNGAGKGNVKIDVCNVCGAKFLDYGELEKIREFSDTEYKETPQEQVMYNQLAEQVQHETLGSIGMFFNEHFKSGNGRKEVENFMNGFLANRRHID